MADCFACGQDMLDAEGCAPDRTIEFDDGETAEPIPYGDESRFGDDFVATGHCHDCGVTPGEPHHPGCDMEECPRCGGQYFICDCETGEKRELWGEADG